MSDKLKESDLNHFTGSDVLYPHPSGVFFTDGLHHVAETAGAFWLIDAIGSYQNRLRHEEFQLWILTVDLDKHTAVLTCASDSGVPPLITQEIEFTDFPLAEIKMYVEHDVLCLPSER